MSELRIDMPSQIACVRREISMRKRVYPRWVSTGRMSQQKADEEIVAMTEVLATLERLHQMSKVIDDLERAMG